GHEGHQMAFREAVIVELFPRRPHLRDGPVGLAELDPRVAGEVELHAALLRHDPVVRQEGPWPDHGPELAGASDPELRPEVMVVFRGEPEAHRALLAVQDPDEFADLAVVLHLHRHRWHAVQIRDQISREDPVVPYEERADERLADDLREGRD